MATLIETKRQHEIHSLSYHFKGNPLQIHVKRSLQAPKNVLESIEEAYKEHITQYNFQNKDSSV